MALLSELPIDRSSLLLCAGLGVLSYAIYSIIYNIYFHPLSRFPGSKLAVCSSLHEFYYDVICKGSFMFEIEKMHKQYGPIIRINPRELHIKDPEFIDELYSSGNRTREKDHSFMRSFMVPNSIVSTIDHNHHRERKGFLKNFFSRRALETLGPFIQESLDLLCKKCQVAKENEKVLRLDSLYTDLTADIITQYAFGSSSDYLRQTSKSESTNDILSAVNENISALHINRFFPVLRGILIMTPLWFLQALRPDLSRTLQFLGGLKAKSERALAGEIDEKEQGTIFAALADPEIPEAERTVPRLMDEGFLVLGAGTVTTARALAMASYYIYTDETILKAMREELETVMPSADGKPSWAELERLPYLTGVIHESLRLTHGATFRQARIAPDEALVYNDWVIPPGTPVAISQYLTHMEPSIFPEPHKFKPERWIEAKEKDFPLMKYLLAFSKGNRQCLGMSLAYLELYLSLAHIVRKLDMEITDTTEENLEVGRDMGVPYPRTAEYCVKAKVIGTQGVAC